MSSDTKKLYAMAARLGLLERDSEEDAFHQLVYGITGKEHVTELTQAEKEEVRAELEKRTELKNTVPGMMTAAQKRLAWRLVYRLDEIQHTSAAPAERLVGAIEKTLGITASRSDPFRWINFNDGIKLIEQLKRYVKSAERRKKKEAENGH